MTQQNAPKRTAPINWGKVLLFASPLLGIVAMGADYYSAMLDTPDPCEIGQAPDLASFLFNLAVVLYWLALFAGVCATIGAIRKRESFTPYMIGVGLIIVVIVFYIFIIAPIDLQRTFGFCSF